MEFLWCSYGISTGILWEFYRILRDIFDISIIYLWCFDEISMMFKSTGFLWDSYNIPGYFCGNSIGFLWCSYGISAIFLRNFYGIPMGFPSYVYDISLGIL
jgi:hypothetical protein